MTETVDANANAVQDPLLDPLAILQSKGIDPGSKRVLDLSVPLDKLPRWVIWLSLILTIVSLIPHVLVYGIDHLFNNMFGLGLFPLVLLGIVLHELAHAVGWKFASGLPWSDFTFGIMWRAAAPYCHAKKPMLVRPYQIGAVLPLILTGILPLIIALILGDATLSLASAFLISAAVGDIYVLRSVQDMPVDALVLDHPSQAGCIILLD